MGREVVVIAKMMDPQAFGNAVEVQALAQVLLAIVLGSQIVGLGVVLIVKTTGPQASKNVVAVRVPAPVVGQQEPHVTGIAVAEHVEENGKHLVQILVASFLGVLRNACLIMQPLVLSTIPQVQLSLLRQLQEIPSGRMELAAEGVSCSLLLLVER